MTTDPYFSKPGFDPSSREHDYTTPNQWYGFGPQPLGRKKIRTPPGPVVTVTGINPGRILDPAPEMSRDDPPPAGSFVRWLMSGKSYGVLGGAARSYAHSVLWLRCTCRLIGGLFALLDAHPTLCLSCAPRALRDSPRGLDATSEEGSARASRWR